MAKVLEALIAKGRRAKRPREQKEVAFGLADLSTHRESPPPFFWPTPRHSPGLSFMLMLQAVSVDHIARSIFKYSNNV